MAPSHYLNQCWDIVNWTIRNKLQWNFYWNSNIEKMHLKMSAKWRLFCLGLNVLIEVPTLVRRHLHTIDSWYIEISRVHYIKMGLCIGGYQGLSLWWKFLYWQDIMLVFHDDVIKWKHFPRYWPFVRGIHQSPVNSLHKGQWRGALMFSLICVWINGWVNNLEAGDLRRYHAHYDVNVMWNDSHASRIAVTLVFQHIMIRYWYLLFPIPCPTVLNQCEGLTSELSLLLVKSGANPWTTRETNEHTKINRKRILSSISISHMCLCVLVRSSC